MPRRRAAQVLVLMALAALGACRGLDSESLDRVLRGAEGPLDERTVVAGLKEALRVGTERATEKTSRVDGFFGNVAIRIVMPEQYQGVANALRRVGLGGEVDDFELTMNRAAERASAEAVDVFWSAITSMTVADAFGILHGGQTAATDYFHDRTAAELHARFEPVVTRSMEAVGLYRIHEDLTARYNQLPFEKPPAVDLDDYITTRTVSGIFTVLADEEKRIREDPAARTTALLRRVFGED